MDIVLFPAAEKAGNELRVNRDEFNKRRVELVHACFKLISDKLRNWTFRADNDVVCIAFKRLPLITDSQHIQNLIECDLIGAYWFVNHSDTSGQLSVGQLWDLRNTLFRVHDALDWPQPFYDGVRALLDKCIAMTSALQFGCEEQRGDDLLAHLRQLAFGARRTGIKERVHEAARSSSCEEYIP